MSAYIVIVVGEILSLIYFAGFTAKLPLLPQLF
jgi:hypothetical protein